MAARIARAMPVPMGSGTTSVTYQTSAGPVTFSGSRDFGGTTPSDATNLGSSPNIRTFSSTVFGWRTRVANTHPDYAHIQRPNETVISHAFYKINNAGDYFPGIVEGSDVTFAFEDVHFSEPVFLVEDTFLVHTLWTASQVDELDHPYHHLHNLHTDGTSYRDLDTYLASGFFSDFPESNYVLNDVMPPTFTGLGTDTIGLSVTIPYELLRALEEEGLHGPPPGLPAPHGFLEPFHIHLEYTLVPEPGTLLLLATGVFALRVRGRRRFRAFP